MSWMISLTGSLTWNARFVVDVTQFRRSCRLAARSICVTNESDAPEERRPYFGCFGLYLRFPIRPAIRPARIIITRNGTESTSRSPCNMSAMRSPPPLSLCLSLNGKGGPLAKRTSPSGLVLGGRLFGFLRQLVQLSYDFLLSDDGNNG